MKAAVEGLEVAFSGEAILLEIGLYLLEIGLRPLLWCEKMDWAYRQKVAPEGGIAAEGCAQALPGKSNIIRPPKLPPGGSKPKAGDLPNGTRGRPCSYATFEFSTPLSPSG